MITYEELKAWPCYGCKYAEYTNYMVPIFYCTYRHTYLKVKPRCRKREDDHPSNYQIYELLHEKGKF